MKDYTTKVNKAKYNAEVKKESPESYFLPANAGDIRDKGSNPGSGGHGNPPQHSCLENLMDRGAWWATVHKVAKSWTRLKQLSRQYYC